MKKNIKICPICGELFHSLGYARHRTAHYERRIGKVKGPMPKKRLKLPHKKNRM